MSWSNEWKEMLVKKSNAIALSRQGDNTDVVAALKQVCTSIGCVYMPDMYDEFIAFAKTGANKRASFDDILSIFSVESLRIKQQKSELYSVKELEQFCKSNKIVLYEDSICERVSLAAHYAGLRNGG